jgi:hypothetical protein
MKHNHAIKILTAAIVASLSFAVQSAPQFVTPAMMKRNGLTDEQYELLWKQGKNPQIDVATARDWIFRASRYANVVEWLEICGKSNDFAKLSHKLQADNYDLTQTNGLLAASVKKWQKDAEGWQASAVEWMNEATNNAARVERVTAALNEKRSEYVEKRDKSALPTTKAIYQAFIDAVDKIKERLEVKDGGN